MASGRFVGAAGFVEARSFFTARWFFVGRGFVAALAEALNEADGCADKLEFGAKLIFEEAFVAEMQRRFLFVKIKNVGGAIFAWVM